LGGDEFAAHFGVPPLVEQRRLKLAALPTKPLALYREGGIKLDPLKAPCLSSDHAGPARAWFGAQPWDRGSALLRKRLTKGCGC
jgi:ParB family transcriptional regulator, chromosome partitioning protein